MNPIKYCIILMLSIFIYGCDDDDDAKYANLSIQYEYDDPSDLKTNDQYIYIKRFDLSGNQEKSYVLVGSYGNNPILKLETGFIYKINPIIFKKSTHFPRSKYHSHSYDMYVADSISLVMTKSINYVSVANLKQKGFELRHNKTTLEECKFDLRNWLPKLSIDSVNGLFETDYVWMDF